MSRVVDTICLVEKSRKRVFALIPYRKTIFRGSIVTCLTFAAITGTYNT